MLTQIKGQYLQLNRKTAEKELEKIFREMFIQKYQSNLQFSIEIEEVIEILSTNIAIRIPDNESVRKGWEQVWDSLMEDYYDKFDHEVYGFEIGFEELKYELPKILLEEITGLRFENIKREDEYICIEFI
ncbi:hypothetical protein [Bacillus thuringiensis]|uniref:hypothetical protein n=1 Tax=Bacillus thuringiensis TaxID=1428 RepID=UPI0021D652A5|nr:hypothetical protein [Bacillus thuringiensis]MCU7666951.1 hypothetical protein [Bacillus thuringiensis]